ncbi:hypothetical protein OEIGOIKO_03367 [Streptomyces chrestomyceticus JCM 4735]|uniref:Uncharacterized protein n=1 Tax=Streptomyces chrestomyceticus JCM 4735 TaxID=1306181 RepID=A0A7U9KUN8_9ACTN|nr:hypothetical protein [Streptomyces chrestomyceticus]GCD35621.1 hypothetical protein OEIGOIKO_03367 [Streptomyces chrestomyceticus JCM 4735]
MLCAGAQAGFNCEVTRCFLGERAVLGHRIGTNRTLVGADAHLSAGLTVAASSLWNNDLRHPDREIIFRVPDGLSHCGTSRFGGVIGDGSQTGDTISLGPGIASGVTLADRIITAPPTEVTHIWHQRPRRVSPRNTTGSQRQLHNFQRVRKTTMHAKYRSTSATVVVAPRMPLLPP